ncbi:MAG: cytochrome b5 domain-containing protein [Candidatus Planktophila sp.]
MDLILGLPVHPLIVHSAAVFIPLSALGVILALFSEKVRKSYLPLILASVVIAVVSGVIASSSGEALAERVGLPQDHANQGEQLRNVVIIFGLLVAVWYFLQRSKDKSFAQSILLSSSLKGLITVAASASLALTVVVGHSGATAAWKDRVAEPAPLTTDTSPAPTQKSGAAGGAITLTAAEVAAHNTASDCWSIVKGNVYNLTSYIQRHPGGPSVLTNICGRDGSAAFSNQHNGQAKPNNVLSGFLLGAVGSSITTTESNKVIAPPAGGYGEDEEGEEEEHEGR